MNKHLLPVRAWLMAGAVILVFLMSQCVEEPFEPDITGTIKGQVKDSDTGDPLENVTITTKPATEVDVTGADGKYTIAKVDTGVYSIIAEKMDYNGKILRVRVNEDQTSRVTILLSESDRATSDDISFTNQFTPVEGAKNQPIAPTLSWQTQNETNSDSLSYDLYLYPSNSPVKTRVAHGLSDTSYTVDPLHYNSVYYWQVRASDDNGTESYSKTLSFKTLGISDNSFFFVRKNKGDYDIMAYDRQRDQVHPLTFNNYRDWAPKINPRNQRIAFVSDSMVKPYLYTMNKNGSNIRRVTDIPVDGYHNYGNAFDWDEDHGKLIFSHYQYLYEIDADGSKMKAITTAPEGRHFREVEISPDGSKILALAIGEKIYNSAIYLMNRDGSNPQVLIDSLEGIVQSPSWSIDGNSILFTHDISGNESLNGRMLNNQIFRLNLSTRDTLGLSQHKPSGTNDLNPRYSPTGAHIIFTNAPNDGSEPPEIWMMNENGGNREMIVPEGELPTY